MANPNSHAANDAEVPGLPESIRLLLASAVSYMHARLELFGLEAKDASINYLKIVLLLLCAVGLVVFSYVFLVISLVFALAYLFHGYWGWVLLGTAILHVVLAVACALIAKSRFKAASFPATVSELKKDKEWLSQTNNTPRSQTLSVVRTN